MNKIAIRLILIAVSVIYINFYIDKNDFFYSMKKVFFWKSKYFSMTRSWKVLLLVFVLCRNDYAIAQEKPVHHETHYHLSGFAGLSTDYKGKTGYKLGIEYEHRFTDHLGLATTFDFTGADFKIFAFSVGASLYPFPFPLVIAIGGGAKSYESKWKPFARGVLLYDFHLDKMSFGPMVMYDLFPDNKDILSYGVTVGFGF